MVCRAALAAPSSGRSAYAVTPGSSRGRAEAPAPVRRAGEPAQRADQLRDVDPGTAVDGRRVLPGQDVDAHVADATGHRG